MRICFLKVFSEMKGIVGSLGSMKIQLKPDDKSVNRWSYRLNSKYKEKVCKELDRMLDAKIIVLVEASDWISPMVVQSKKTLEICICVDLRSLNATCVHDPFLTPYVHDPFHILFHPRVSSQQDSVGWHNLSLIVVVSRM
jgi:hypothetical protein